MRFRPFVVLSLFLSLLVGASMIGMGSYLLVSDTTLQRGAARLVALGVVLCALAIWVPTVVKSAKASGL